MATSAHVLELTDANFDSEVISSPVPVLVDFWAEWCMPCRALGPVIDSIANESAGRFKVGKVDIDANRDTAMKYRISAIPTIIIFKGGKVVKQFVGLSKKEALVAALNEA